jgi:hypothetical protein
VLLELNVYQLNAFAQRWDYCFHEVFEWVIDHRTIPERALAALGDQNEMAKITGETR